jgi:hypothetical protein
VLRPRVETFGQRHMRGSHTCCGRAWAGGASAAPSARECMHACMQAGRAGGAVDPSSVSSLSHRIRPRWAGRGARQAPRRLRGSSGGGGRGRALQDRSSSIASWRYTAGLQLRRPLAGGGGLSRAGRAWQNTMRLGAEGGSTYMHAPGAAARWSARRKNGRSRGQHRAARGGAAERAAGGGWRGHGRAAASLGAGRPSACVHIWGTVALWGRPGVHVWHSEWITRSPGRQRRADAHGVPTTL